MRRWLLLGKRGFNRQKIVDFLTDGVEDLFVKPQAEDVM